VKRICVYGAGAIGAHLAARLAAAGAEMSVIARGAHLAAMQARGITLRSAEGDQTYPVQAAENAAEIGPVDAVLVTVKAPALPAVAAGIAPLLGPDTPVAFIMNGIPWWYFDGIGGALEGKRLSVLDPGDALRRAIGVERAIGGVIYAASAVVAPGIVTSEHADLKLFLGEPGGVVSPRAQALAALLSTGGMPTDAVGNIRHRIWGKLLGNMVVGPLCLLSRQDMKATLADPAIFEAGVRISDEGTALARALGHDLKVPGEVRMRRFGETAHKPSILQDLELGRPMEIDALFTAPLQLGQDLGVPMPNFALMVALARQAATAAGLYQPPMG
jgi:2-dehydropantoate 2-reductase